MINYKRIVFKQTIAFLGFLVSALEKNMGKIIRNLTHTIFETTDSTTMVVIMNVSSRMFGKISNFFSIK